MQTSEVSKSHWKICVEIRFGNEDTKWQTKLMETPWLWIITRWPLPQDKNEKLMKRKRSGLTDKTWQGCNTHRKSSTSGNEKCGNLGGWYKCCKCLKLLIKEKLCSRNIKRFTKVAYDRTIVVIIIMFCNNKVMCWYFRKFDCSPL